MIRPCESKDMPDLMNIAESFYTGYCDGQLDFSLARELILNILVQGISFRSDNGFIGGIIMPHPFTGHSVLVELAWWSQDKSGTKLLNKFIQAGKDEGVHEIRMSTMGTSSDTAAKIIQRKGFAVAETQYSLTL